MSTDHFTWDTAAANVGLLRDNFFELFGKETPQFLSQIQLPINLKGSSTQYLKNIPEEAKPWLAVAAGVTFVIIKGSGNKKTRSEKVAANKTESIQATSDAIGSLTDELG